MHNEERQPLLGGPIGHSFTITAHDLMEFVDPKNPDALRRLGGIDGVCRSLRVDPHTGLSSAHQNDIEMRRRAFGDNTLPIATSKSIWQLMIASLDDKTLIMLTVAAIVSLIIGLWQDFSSQHPPNEPRVRWVEGAAILSAIVTVVLTNTINDYQKELQFKKLNRKKEDKRVTVVRDGREQSISVVDLVVGDVLMFEPGDVAPVDCVYLSGYNLACDESSATGESEAVKKEPAQKLANEDIDCFILSGSKVLEGVAYVLAIAVGTNSFYGKTMVALRTSRDNKGGVTQQSTPLQLKLDVLAEQIAKFGFGAAITMLVTLVIKYFATTPDISGAETMSTLINIVIQTITIIVVAVPEGLPMAVTMSLAFATTQMLKDSNLVRVLSACETMGNATTICTDKTGTITQNRMTVVKGTVGMETFEDSDAERWMQGVHPVVVDLVVQGVSINSTAYRDGEDFLGSTTECALLVFAGRLGGDFSSVRHGADIVKVYPFTSRRKSMSTIVRLDQSSYRTYTKGAPEIVLRNCTRYINAFGDAEMMDGSMRRYWEKVIDKYAGEALRTIALAYSTITNEAFGSLNDDGEPRLEDLVLIGIVGIEDPLRPGVIESVAAFRRAGVFVRMITGDNIKTATAIAKSAGILTNGGLALNGSEFRDMSPERQRSIIPRLQVLARSSPIDKTTVVIRLQELDQVVGMTGDGTNDGPALKLADVGFSMGISGTEVAKEASDIVLMDDNFNSILKALLWGRTVNDSVRKFLTFQLTVNVTAVVISFVSAIISPRAESVLSAVQLLWVNLIMDTLAALALATEKPTDKLLDRKPASKYAHLINYWMVKMILGQSIFQIIVNLTLIYAGGSIFGVSDEKVLRTMVFNTFVFLQVFNEINCRRVDATVNIFAHITKDWLFLAIQLGVIVGQFLIVTFGGIAFSTTPLTAMQWLATVLIGALSLPVGLLIRILPDCCGLEKRFNEDARPLTSYSRLNWESAIGHLQSQLRVYSILRKSYHCASSQSPDTSRRQLTQQQPTLSHSPPQSRSFSVPTSDPSRKSSRTPSIASAPATDSVDHGSPK
ncbi:PMCA-type calcium-translocating P-type ATPase [Dichotomocladium elegans]|nr:PMCA-type calcium-translocating P-type ATPase [Dichotomocladium elegans]